MNNRHHYAIFVAVMTFLLIIAGGLVTSTGSGLAVPDWPLAFGQWFPRMEGGVFFEHGHRLVAATVGILTMVLAFWFWIAEKRLWLRRLGPVAAGVVCLQGLLGGLTVILRLPMAVSVLHACLAQSFFCLVVAVARMSSPSWETPPSKGVPPSFFKLSLVTSLALFLQLILGALVRHSGGSFLAPHMINAFVVFLLIGNILKNSLINNFNKFTSSLAFLMVALVFIQLILGFLNYFWGTAVVLATAHVAVGALLLACSVLLTMESGRSQDPYAVRILFHSFSELTKPRLTSLVLVTTFVGYWLGAADAVLQSSLFSTMLGTGLLAAGAAALNQVMEKNSDAKMKRTQNRPLPQGRLEKGEALLFGVSLCVLGLIVLSLWVNLLTSVLGVLTLAIYLFVYTPLKAKTSLCTLVGAVPGALPPMMGWTAARGTLNLEAWILFGILFFWQLPHFLALAWLYREDYARAGFPMLTVEDPQGGSTSRQIMLYMLGLLPMALLPTVTGFTGALYFFGALVLTLLFLGLGLETAIKRSLGSARRLFIASVLYLPTLFSFMLMDLK